MTRQRGVVLLWWIWGRRNEKVFNDKEVPHFLVRDTVTRLVEDHGKYSKRIYGAVRKSAGRSARVWSAPPEGFIKVNCDASLSVNGWSGLGAVARDSDGAVLFAATRRTRGECPPELAEGRAVLVVVKLARKYGLRKVIIEGDCQGLMSRLSKASTYFSDLDSILDDVFYFSSSFDYVSWSHVRRDGNYVAHHLARLMSFGFEQVWENHCPVEVSSYVLMDKLSID